MGNIFSPSMLILWEKSNLSKLNILKEKLLCFIIYPSEMGTFSVMLFLVGVAGGTWSWSHGGVLRACTGHCWVSCPGPDAFTLWGCTARSQSRCHIKGRETIFIIINRCLSLGSTACKHGYPIIDTEHRLLKWIIQECLAALYKWYGGSLRIDVHVGLE